MDSLFDASEFEVKPEVVTAPVEPVAGQLDIFGNVIELAEIVTPERAAKKLEERPGESSTEVSSDVPSTLNADLDPLEAAELIGATVTPTDAVDTTVSGDDGEDGPETLNDPTWEPDIESTMDVDDELVADLLEPSHAPTQPLGEYAENRIEHAVGPDGKRLRSVDGLWSAVVGQTSAVELLRSAAQQPIHAYLFVGPSGSGRRQAARSFGAALLCPDGGCGLCNICVRTMAELHPDFVVVEREGASISVDQAREIIRLALRSPLEGTRKVLVLTDFHLVTNAGPTLLKIIEEPPPSTVFVVLAEQVTNELVTIASRCVQVPFVGLALEAVVSALINEGVASDRAEQAARAAGGRLDRARLLATDPELASRFSFWQTIPRRLDGTGAAVAVIAAEAVNLVDNAAVGPLEERQARELKDLEDRLEISGSRGGVGLKKELAERHKRELKRLRDDELRFGFTALQHVFHQRALDSSISGPEIVAALRGVTRIGEANEQLIRNPNVGLLLQSLLLDLSPR